MSRSKTSPVRHRRTPLVVDGAENFPIGCRVVVVTWGWDVRLWMVGIHGRVIAHNRNSIRVEFEDSFGIGSDAHRYGSQSFRARPSQIREAPMSRYRFYRIECDECGDAEVTGFYRNDSESAAREQGWRLGRAADVWSLGEETDLCPECRTGSAQR